MNVVGIVFAAEFLRRIESRPWLFSTIIGAIAVALTVLFPVLARQGPADLRPRIVLSGPPALTARAVPLLRTDFDVVAVVATAPVPPDAPFLDARGPAAALVVLSAAPQLQARVFARDVRFPRARLARDLAAPVPVETITVTRGGAPRSEAASTASIGVLLFLYVSIMLNAQLVLTSVAEEKTSRIAELLVATISPTALLSGKLLAALAAGMTQIAVLGGAAIASLLATLGPLPDAAVVTAAFDPWLLGAFAVAFALGLAQYALLYAGAASLISRPEDLGSISGPLVIPVLAGGILAQFTLLNPHVPALVVLSLVPLLSPFVMLARIAATAVPSWQLVLALVINLVATAAIVVGAGKIYRVGLLSYGRLPHLRQILAALRA
jgi:ABC-type Na+ efflux pump permease subunit